LIYWTCRWYATQRLKEERTRGKEKCNAESKRKVLYQPKLRGRVDVGVRHRAMKKKRASRLDPEKLAAIVSRTGHHAPKTAWLESSEAAFATTRPKISLGAASK
jgi:hypothetical protein